MSNAKIPRLSSDSDYESSSPPSPSSSTMKKRRILEFPSPLEQITNPFENPALVSIIVRKVTKTEDLKNLRLLNRMWRNRSLEHWRNTACLVIDHETRDVLMEAYRCIDEEEEELLDLLYPVSEDEGESSQSQLPSCSINPDPFQLREKPFKNFRIAPNLQNYWTYPVPTFYSYQDRHFWDVCMHHARYLDLGDCLFRRSELWDYFAGLHFILKNCPLLIELKMSPFKHDLEYPDEDLEEEDFEEEEEEEMLESDVKTLSLVYENFRRYPASDRLFLGMDVEQAKAFFGRFFFNVQNLHLQRTGKNLLLFGLFPGGNLPEEIVNLETLSIVEAPILDCAKVNQILNYIQRARPPLKNLKFAISGTDCLPYPFSTIPQIKNDYRLYKMLHPIRNRLKNLELTIDCDRDYRPTKIRFPPNCRVLDLSDLNFVNLTLLDITLRYGPKHNGLISFNFGNLRGMKSLKIFRFLCGEQAQKIWMQRKLGAGDLLRKNNGIADLKGAGGVLPKQLNLRKLEEFHFHGNFTSEALQLMGVWMKNLRKFGAVFDEENFETVLETWPSLKKLTIMRCSNVTKDVLALLNTTEIKVQHESKLRLIKTF